MSSNNAPYIESEIFAPLREEPTSTVWSVVAGSSPEACAGAEAIRPATGAMPRKAAGAGRRRGAGGSGR